MKQPELGQKIFELRKAKGLTQEELVEQCNLNVRTIQRIEAGEVTPRSYTIRSIFAALGQDFETNSSNEKEIHKPLSQKARLLFITALISGLIYFLLAFVESYADWSLFVNNGTASFFPLPWYVIVKISILISFSFFMLGFYQIAAAKKNLVLSIASLLMIGGVVLSTISDVYTYDATASVLLMTQISKAIMYGALYIVLGVGLAMLRHTFGSLALITGVTGIATGCLFISVVLALPGLIVLTVFDILCLVLLYQSYVLLNDAPVQTV